MNLDPFQRSTTHWLYSLLGVAPMSKKSNDGNAIQTMSLRAMRTGNSVMHLPKHGSFVR